MQKKKNHVTKYSILSNKNLNKVRIERTYFNMIKAIYEISTDNILNWEN